MRKGTKRLISIAAAAVMACGALSLAACGERFTPLEGDYTSTAPAVSNGGFVVEYGKYVYFINGVEAYTANNTYGKPVKGALMRIAKSDLLAGNNTAETVIPSLMVAADYTSGLYIYNGRVYYATPTNVKNTSGVVENTYLDFKSAKLDGSDIQDYFRVDTNSTVYRFVQPEKDGDVYLMYVVGSSSPYTIKSYNTATKQETDLVRGATGYIFSKDVTNPYAYYTMSVQDNLDTEDSATTRNDYNQVYRVRADVTEAPYEYTWDEEYLNDHNGEAPYHNLGTIVLDGIGKSYMNDGSQFTHDLEEGVEPAVPAGYTYTLQTYNDEGLYFLRKETTEVGGTSGELYFLDEAELDADWNSIAGNASGANGTAALDVVAQNDTTSHASASAIYYRDEQDAHHYLYVSGSSIYRVDVATDGNGGVVETEICRDANGATLVSRDDTSDEKYDYVYFTRTNGSGTSVERAVYNGSGRNYDTLPFEGDEDNKPYKPVKVLDLQHATSWYQFEIIDGVLLYADAEPIGSVSYNYISAVNLTKGGKLMNNVELEEVGELYKELTDASDGYFAQVAEETGDSVLQTAYRYFFYTGKTDAFYDNIQKAVDAGKSETYLYTEEQQEAFKNFTEGKGDTEGKFVDGEGKSYRVRSYFITPVGAFSEQDEKAVNDYWAGALKNYTVTEVKESLPDWGIALIAVGSVLAVAAIAVGIVLGIRAKKKKAALPHEEKMRVDTTDDRSVDVYADEAENAEEAVEEPVAESVEEAAAEPAEEALEAEETPEEAPAEAASEDTPNE